MSSPKRGDTELSFMIGVDKPAGMTSHDVVDKCRHAFGERRVGHGGTLDPDATGVLPILVGPATRLSNYFDGCKKSYKAVVILGSATSTDDAEGEVIKRGTIKPEFYDKDFAKKYCNSLIGKHMQVPPQYSAIKVDGKKAYEVARGGDEIELKAREIEIFKAQVVDVDRDGKEDAPYWIVNFTVSSGTYIRSIARDLGEDLGCCAHIFQLQRLSVGNIGLMNSANMFKVSKAMVKPLDPCEMLSLLTYAASEDDAKAVANGNEIAFDASKVYNYDMGRMKEFRGEVCAGEKFFIATKEEVLAVYVLGEDLKTLRAETVFSIGVMRCLPQ